MPLYMDVHLIPGVKAKDVASAHELDMALANQHECTCMTYWIDENRESVFCLIEGPSREAVETLHAKAHGLIPHKVIEVNASLVDSFLGRIYDPESATIDENGLKVFEDSSFRVLLVTQPIDRVLLGQQLGKEKAEQNLQQLTTLIRKNVVQYNGREAEHRGDGFILSFISAKQAVACAFAIQNAIFSDGLQLPGFKMAINAGEPVENTEMLFGDTIRVANFLCEAARDNQVAIAASVQELLSKEPLPRNSEQVVMLSPQDERLLEQLFGGLEENWNESEFDLGEYSQAVAMSQSQLYRKTISLTGLSPNTLLMNYRLGKAKDMMRQQRHSISQITFEAGFSSPSYFTKCFKKKYGLLPMTYLELLH